MTLHAKHVSSKGVLHVLLAIQALFCKFLKVEDQNVKIIVFPITSQMIHQEPVVNVMFPAKNV